MNEEIFKTKNKKNSNHVVHGMYFVADTDRISIQYSFISWCEFHNSQFIKSIQCTTLCILIQVNKFPNPTVTLFSNGIYLMLELNRICNWIFQLGKWTFILSIFEHALRAHLSNYYSFSCHLDLMQFNAHICHIHFRAPNRLNVLSCICIHGPACV